MPDTIGIRRPSPRQPSAKPWQSLSPGIRSAITLRAMPGERILLVEDEPTISEPFSKALAREGFDAVVAGTLAEARRAVERRTPDLVLLDLRLPDGDGRDFARELRAAGDVPIIMLTARGTELDRIVGLELGADDYVVKPFSGAEVVARIRAVLRGTGRQDDEPPAAPIGIGALEIDPAARRVRLEGREIELSRKEFDLLLELARHAGDVVRREDLMSRVWDENWFGSTKTLDVHVGWLRRKLGDPAWIETVRGVGFRCVEP
jgi:two-component system, OmpR family, response regulator RegX3